MTTETEVTRHYTRSGLEDAIVAALRSAGKDVETLDTADLAAVDEFHLGWRPQTEAFAETLGLAPGMAVLDIGSGLGGPARLFAQYHGCTVTGLDLTPDFVATARGLTARTGLAGRVTFVQGSALAMPFEAESFDAATLIHVGMNIADKARLFVEAARVLRPGGQIGVYDVMRVADGEIPMPMPWASTPETSFVDTADTYLKLLREAGFVPDTPRDRSGFVAEVAAAAQARRAGEGDPLVGLHLVIGPTAAERVGRLRDCIAEGVLAPVEILARRG
jgi:SAM-dependent methyltransferase